MSHNTGHEGLRLAGKSPFVCCVANYGTYLENLMVDLDDGSVEAEDYADKLRERMVHAITMFDAQELGINAVKVGKGTAQHKEKIDIKKVCGRGRAGVRSLMEKVEPGAPKTELMVGYNAELSHIVRTHSTIITEHTRRLIDLMRGELDRAAMVLHRSEIAKNAGSRRERLNVEERSQEHKSWNVK